MSLPPHDDGYTWPTAPAGRAPEPVRRPRPAATLPPFGATTDPRTTWRRWGYLAGGVLSVTAVWAGLFTGHEPPTGLGIVAVALSVGLVALVFERVRAFAVGFLVGTALGAVGAFVALYLFIVAVFSSMGP